MEIRSDSRQQYTSTAVICSFIRRCTEMSVEPMTPLVKIISFKINIVSVTDIEKLNYVSVINTHGN